MENQERKKGNSGDIYEQAFVKTLAGFFHGNSKHLFGITRFRGASRLRSGRPVTIFYQSHY
jgi:hypothetical protein